MGSRGPLASAASSPGGSSPALLQAGLAEVHANARMPEKGLADDVELVRRMLWRACDVYIVQKGEELVRRAQAGLHCRQRRMLPQCEQGWH